MRLRNVKGSRETIAAHDKVIEIGTEYMADRYQYVHYELHGDMFELADNEKC